jgi:pimeloyl-ACP methyl ester carboxylesterase
LDTARRGLALLQVVSPRLAAEVAGRLFLTPPRIPAARNNGASPMPDASPFDLGKGRHRLAVWTTGRGPTVLLVHGWGGRASQMRAFVEPLVRAGHTVVAFDAPAHGRSAGRRLSLPGYAAAITRVAEATGPLHGIIAHSFGAPATAVAVAGGLKVGRAVFLGPPADERNFLDRFATLLGLSDRTRRLTGAVTERIVGAPFDRFTASTLGPRLELPLLVVHDREDNEVPWSDGERVARALRRGTLYTTVGLGHRGILREPAVVERVIRFVTAGSKSAPPRCARCGATLIEAWDPGGAICMRCGLELELSDRDGRRDRNPRPVALSA